MVAHRGQEEAVNLHRDPKAELLGFYTLGHPLGKAAQPDLGCSCAVWSQQMGAFSPSHGPELRQGPVLVMSSGASLCLKGIT